MTEPEGRETYYSYNILNQLTQVSMPRGATTQTRTFNYNLATGRLTSATNPENGTVSYSYNADGTLASKTDAKGQRIEYSYNELKQVTQIRRGETVDLYYGNSAFSQNAAGRLATVASTNGFTEMYSYTAAGLVTQKRLRLTRSANSADLDGVWTYDNEGRMTSVQYPQGGTYNYSYDTLGRPSGMTEQQDRLVQWVKNVAYNQAGAMTAMSWLSVKGDTPGEDEYYSETRQYNVRLQLTRLTVAGQMDLDYRYSPTQNNGRITQMKDYVSGEEVSYAYDSLNRLISAVTTGPEWGQNYSYDGFGNMAAQTVTKGTAPQWTLGINQATNRIVTDGFSYDANGNLTQMPNSTGFTDLTYDAENRLSQAVDPNASNRYEQYAYGVDNKRVYKRVQAGEGNKTEYVYFYGVTGQKLATFRIEENPLRFTLPSTNLYFGGKLISKSSQAVVVDRLGSVGGPTKYYPYGQERQTTYQDTEKFATYHRDSTNLDYADQRYYTSAWGRFLTPDPYQSSGGPADPQSWNRYAYVVNDPVNYNDPTGEIAVKVGPGGVYIPVIPIVFIANVFLKIFGGGGGTIRDPGWQTDAQVNAQVAAREKAFWQDHEDDDEDNVQNPTFLKLADDCYKKQLFGGASLVRRRRYQVLDEWGEQMRVPGAVRVQERHDVRFAPRGFTTGGAWGQGSWSPLNEDAMFDDWISTGSLGAFWTYQSFTGSSPGNVNRPLMVIDGSNMWTTLGIHATPTRININGNDGPYLNGKLKECDTPDIK